MPNFYPVFFGRRKYPLNKLLFCKKELMKFFKENKQIPKDWRKILSKEWFRVFKILDKGAKEFTKQKRMKVTIISNK